jgi:hypothetical protein
MACRCGTTTGAIDPRRVQLFFSGQVLNPSTDYSAQLPSAEVASGTKPIQPQTPMVLV